MPIAVRPTLGRLALGVAFTLTGVGLGTPVRALDDPLVLRDGFRFAVGDDPEWAAPSFDDRGFELAGPTDSQRERGRIAWFRRQLDIAAGLRGRDIGLLVELRGSAQVFLDGTAVHVVGSFAQSGGQAAQRFGGRYARITLPDAPQVLLAVRYDDRPNRGLDWLEPAWGFRLILADEAALLKRVRSEARLVGGHQMMFVGAFTGQAVLHLLLFLFYRRIRSNLYFALTALLAALLAGFHFELVLSEDPAVLAVARVVWGPLLFAAMLALLQFCYEVYDHPRGAVFWSFFTAGVAGGVITAVTDLQAFSDLGWFQLLIILEMLRVTAKAARQGSRGAWIILVGLCLLFFGLLWQLLLVYGVLRQPWSPFPVGYYGVAALLLAVSVFLSFVFARMGRTLRERLAQVEDLTRTSLEHQMQARLRELENQMLEADNRRKGEELEGARQLQLALLPSTIPRLPHLQIATSMQTATEVGGDYYDFYVGEDGSLTAAMGDATGHGARAGALVSLVKGMLTTTSTRQDFARFFREAGASIRAMDLNGVNVAMALARIEPKRLVYSSAGMPPALVYRASSRQVDELLVEGMPLGGIDGFPYAERETELAPGDVVLLLSDGLPELLNGAGEALGYDRMRQLLAECGERSPQEVLDHLNSAAREWSGGPPFPDDITFVVLRVEDGSGTPLEPA